MKIKGDYLLDTIGGEKMAVPITVNDGGTGRADQAE